MCRRSGPSRAASSENLAVVVVVVVVVVVTAAAAAAAGATADARLRLLVRVPGLLRLLAFSDETPLLHLICGGCR
jgi:hypothetical protein